MRAVTMMGWVRAGRGGVDGREEEDLAAPFRASPSLGMGSETCASGRASDTSNGPDPTPRRGRLRRTPAPAGRPLDGSRRVGACGSPGRSRDFPVESGSGPGSGSDEEPVIAFPGRQLPLPVMVVAESPIPSRFASHSLASVLAAEKTSCVRGRWSRSAPAGGGGGGLPQVRPAGPGCCHRLSIFRGSVRVISVIRSGVNPACWNDDRLHSSHGSMSIWDGWPRSEL